MTDLGLGGSLLACAFKLLMAGHDHHLGLLGSIAELEQHLCGLEDRCVPPTHWINHLQAPHRWDQVGSNGVWWGHVGLRGVGSRRVGWGGVGWSQVG